MNSATGEGQKSPSCRVFTLAEIQSATENFDDELVIGEGGFGKVYKGQIYGEEASHVVAIKRLDSMSNQGELEFRAEIDMLSKLRHCHLVSLIGYCQENKEMILVYEYMPNGTLYHHLHKSNIPLSWITRLKIAIGAARGLDYLHTGVGTQHGVIHRDVKSSNILLDEKWEAMISDFGLSKIGPTNQLISYVDASVKGTFGYLDPEYFYTRKLTRKTDVYAFGVVLFELLSGRLPVDERNEEDECSLVRWAQKCVKEKKFDQIVDPNIKGTIFPKCLRRFAQIANRCVHNDPKERPTMTEVVASLQTLLELQEKSNHSSESSGTLGFNWKIHKYFVSTAKPNSDQNGTSSPNQHEELKVFTYDELKVATRDFGSKISFYDKSYGTVYKGWVDKTTYSPCNDNSGLPVIIKELDYKLSNPQALKEFRHPNIVKLIGYSLRRGCHFLVYEFMHNGKFEGLLQSGAVARLTLVQKVKVLVGIARGIVFLQKLQLNQRWLKVQPALERRKILLDEEFTAKFSGYDFGHFDIAFPDIDEVDLVLESNISCYKVIFAEVLTGKRIYSSDTVAQINRLFSHWGKESLDHIAQLCFEMCNEVDLESKMLNMLKDHVKLIRDRLKSWLDDPRN